jgi:hypothetical protein
VQLGYPGVEGGNRITVVKIASKSNAYDLHLLPLAAPTTGQTVVVGALATSYDIFLVMRLLQASRSARSSRAASSRSSCRSLVRCN